MEIYRKPFRGWGPCLASMWPWFFNHGNSPCLHLLVRGEISLQCGHDFSIMEITALNISTKTTVMLQCGHDFSIMEIVLKFGTPSVSKELQCGHDFSIMEIGQYSWSTRIFMDASMWPWFFNHGNGHNGLRDVFHSLASMWPWFFNHGNIVFWGKTMADNVWLQCGHDFSIMEITTGLSGAYNAVKLQCGHDFSIMEIHYYSSSGKRSNSVASMWPWFFNHGNLK